MTDDHGYSPLFNPDRSTQPFDPARVARAGDQLPRSGYVYDQDGRIALAVNVALATGRPLLVRGVPGTGKSSLAADVANRLSWRSYAHTITSRTQARDLLWMYDAVGRLNDASRNIDRGIPAYLSPGVLWWAFDPAGAATRGLRVEELGGHDLTPLEDPSPRREAERAVVLLDEIDKADPDLPNDLLLPLGSLRFRVEESGYVHTVEQGAAPLVIATTNEERDLPAAFLRRCVVLVLHEPGEERLKAIARAHFGSDIPEDRLDRIRGAFEDVREEAGFDGHRPGVAEFLDAVAAAIALSADEGGTALWEQVIEVALRKPGPQE